MKHWFTIFFIGLLLATTASGQPIRHSYRFNGKLSVAQPGCGPELSQVKAAGNCNAGSISSSYTEDLLPCGVRRQIYHTNVNWGLKYDNSAGTITENYTIQMYIKVTDWGKTWARIIDFSDGQLDEGIYFKDKNGSADRCIDFYPSGIAGPCPYFNTSTYYLLTFTRNGQTGIMDVYVNDVLFVSYNDSQRRYVGKTGVPIYIFRDDAAVSCESGSANFAYLSFSDQFSGQTDVNKAYSEICSVANFNISADFSLSPNPSCVFSENVKVAYTGDVPSPGAGNTTYKDAGSGFFVYGSEYIFEWNWGGGSTVSGSKMGPYQVKWATQGMKSVTLTITSTTCPDNKIVNTKTILISDLDVTATWEDATCTNDLGKITLTPANGTAPFVYSVDSVNFQKDSIFAVSPDTYKITIKDANNCVATKSLTIDGPGKISVQTIPDSTICNGQKIQLTTVSDGTDFSWEPAAGLDDATAKNPVASPSVTTKYIVTAKKDSCTIQRDTVVITVSPTITIIATPDSEIEPGVPFQLNASSPELNGVSGVTYDWVPPSGLSDSAIRNPYATIADNVTYTVKVVSPEGCSAFGEVKLSIRQAASIFIPDAFSPNGDGINEQFLPIIRQDFSLKYFRIYSRWGEVIFFSIQADQGWDGQFKGLPVASGSYVYTIEAITGQGKTVRKEGSVLLIR
jgi:gliding motility-associated-like protein